MIRRASYAFSLIVFASSAFAASPRVQEHTCKPAIPNARCGFIQVLENRGEPNGRKINIEFIQIRSTAKDREPDAWVEVNGGPGVASTPSVPDLLPVFGYVLKKRDLIFYDQRGTGASNPLHCDLHKNAPPAEAADFLPAKGVRDCARQFAGQADFSQYNTAVSVEDFDELRAALGYDKLTLAGLSYGTRLSQAYMLAHPDHVRAAMFEGALRPDSRIPLEYAHAMQKALDGVLADCRADPACKPVANQIDLKKISRSERLGDDQVSFTPEQFFEALRVLLYNGETARQVPLMLRDVTRGNAAALARLQQVTQSDDPMFSWPLWLSVTCAEDTPFISEDEIGPATKGTLIGDYRIRQQQRACKLWPVPRRKLSIGKPTNIPVLIMEGQYDVATPMWSDEDVHRYFPNGRQVVLPHAGHLLIGLEGMECLDKIESQFLEELDVKVLDTTCTSGIHRKPFVVEEKQGK